MGGQTDGLLKRRGLVAGMAALGAAVLSRMTLAERAEAGHDAATAPSPTNTLHLGVINDGGNATNDFINTAVTDRTALIVNTNLPGLQVVNRDTGSLATGMFGTTVGTGAGVAGSFAGGVLSNGVQAGVFGTEGGSSGASGVYGRGSLGLGVRGESSSGSGVFGVSKAADARLVAQPGTVAGVSGQGFGRIGVQALSDSQAGLFAQSTSGYGAFARSQSGPGMFGGSTTSIGVYADSGADSAVFATSPARGVWGRTTAGVGVFGQAIQNGGIGVYGAAPLVVNTWAGYFEGNVYVTGNVYTGGGAVLSPGQAADGSLRALHSVDSAEPVIEDFGQGRLVNGRAEVRLDPDFAALATGDAYMVFLTEEGDHNALFVEKKSPTIFVVRAKGSAAGGTFDYRVVAKRRGGSGKRLERLERPRPPRATHPEPPKLPYSPTPGDRPRGERPDVR